MNNAVTKKEYVLEELDIIAKVESFSGFDNLKLACKHCGQDFWSGSAKKWKTYFFCNNLECDYKILNGKKFVLCLAHTIRTDEEFNNRIDTSYKKIKKPYVNKKLEDIVWD